MSSTDSIFLDVDGTPGQVAEWMVVFLGFEVVGVEPERVVLRGRPAEAEGWLGVVVRRNGYVSPDPEPGEVQAIDGYGVEVSVKYDAKTEAVLHGETRRIFERLVDGHPGVPMVLCEELAILVAAHLPGAGTKYFDGEVTLDAPDVEVWRPWVSSRSHR
ncbi:hypothetical protein Kfla_4605 [Kribbella flavida DSM 17836]|uniref:Uncharacterized protein n=1 Tax=Kribbella flavida (strain DSM 17836 / JCM 10339 / NBRC 14399) TaxID=479435 RepID=D2PY17_KRIFD|nr:hypothetical protein [Kribbella flavida]ADB33623.1 hypothetical protein Kfla_4605 [Kribbella flavida DSM 17836]